jgi:DedD protein
VDIRAKERLTGAVILVALVVLVVPELLSGPDQRAAKTPASGEEPSLRSVTLELGDERGTEEVSPPSKGTMLAAVPEPTPAARSAASGSSAPAPQRELPSGTEATQPAQSPAVQPVSPQVQSAQSPQAQPVQGSQAPRTHQLARGTQAAHAQRAVHAPGWTVQVGSFEGREHADRLVHRLRAAGFAAFVSESESHGRRWYRVRVGPERDRTAARAMVVRLHAAGHSGSIVPP